ncbi:ABC transporter permease [Ectobacillus sp. JY-23]|uniref:ABC transporter permease n=1 Tax=Ectobacillus sp. JY-23 TaxID=2933872 RepID=UPI001FF285E1|nr:ABC transporter permease [Ectobacillus sp. JY-23]UOY91155.1 ABC transporter permease [Ectobacillus sp. JY-23]
MNAIKTVLQEQFQNLYLIRRLSAYELKQAYASNALGSLWIFLNPLIQVSLYWLVFGLGIRGGQPVQGIPYFVWMICGLIPWFFISAATGQGSSSIYSRLNTVAKMNFPLSIIPTYVVSAQLYTHGLLLIVLLGIVILSQGFSDINIFGLIYGVGSLTVFLVCLAFVTSTFSTVLRDVHMLVQSFMRMLFFVTPVLWEPKENMPEFFLMIIKLNPFYYIIEVYRSSLVYGDMSVLFSGYTLYFWTITIVLFVIGATMHIKFRKQFVDYL